MCGLLPVFSGHLVYGNTTLGTTNTGGHELETQLVKDMEELEEAGTSWKAMLLTALEELEEVEEAGGSLKAMLLALLLQLCKLLAMHSGGATCTWRQLRRRRVRQGRRGGRGGSAVQQWWRQLRSYAHQRRCGWVRGNKGDSAEELQ